MTNTTDDRAHALLSLLRIGETMINMGVTLIGTLYAMRDAAETPYREALETVAARIEKGETLFGAMKDMPELFPPLLQLFVRAGEVGGVLDETLRRATELLEEDWRYRGQTEWPSLVFSAEAKPARDLADLSPVARLRVQMIFCHTFGLLLSSGVPILQSMESTAPLLPPNQEAEWRAAIDRIRTEKCLTAPFLPSWVQVMIGVAQETGTLDIAFTIIAGVFRRELDDLRVEMG